MEVSEMEGLFDDLTSLKLGQDYADTVGVKKVLNTVPVGKPNKQDFVRVHPAPEFRLSPAALIELKDDRESYLVTPTMAANLPGEFSACSLFLTTNRQGVLRVWPVKLPGPDGKINPWHQSAADAAERAMTCWVRVTANMSLGAYELFEATGNLPEPKWPEEHSFREILQIAFRGRVVDSPDHPLVLKLQGQT
jgi:hypothetical protein